MLGKPKFNWRQDERTLLEVVSEDGAMQPGVVLYIAQQLCRSLEGRDGDTPCCIHPQAIIVSVDGAVQLSARELPLSAREAYIPPEQDQFDKSTDSGLVYALGMVMLFMATGQEKKASMDTFIDNRPLRDIIARCIAFDPQMRFQNISELSAALRRANKGVGKVLLSFVAIICIGVVAVVAFRFYHGGQLQGEYAGREVAYTSGYAYGYEKGYSDAAGIGVDGAPFHPENGNLSGNIAGKNGAVAAYSRDEIFFLHKGSIYRMNPYTKETKLLVEDGAAYGLNYYEGWIYYSTDQSICRINPQTMKEEVFCDERTGLLYIADGGFYLHDRSGAGYLYRINPDTGDLTQLNDITEYSCLNIVGEKLYFVDPNSGSIYCCDLDGSGLRIISSSYCESICIYGGKIYAYAASFEKDEVNYSASFLISMDLDGGDIESFTNIPAYCLNVSEGGVFYIAGNNRTLEWMSPGGRTHYTILTTPTGTFNIAGRWIFYTNEEDGGALWRVRIDGSDNGRVVTN